MGKTRMLENGRKIEKKGYMGFEHFLKNHL